VRAGPQSEEWRTLPGAAEPRPIPGLQDTIARDLKQVYLNLKLVVFPFGSDREQQAQALRNWDLWGPMVRPRRRH